MSNIILDIETIPLPKDRILAYKDQFEPDTPKRGRKPKKSSMGGLHWLTGRLVCVGIKPMDDREVIFCHEDEELIFDAMVDYLDHTSYNKVITFNGKSFDLPFLRMRGALYGYNMELYFPYDRFTKDHIDIYDVLGGKWGLSAKLAEYAWFFGLKSIVGTGSEVEKLFKEGNLDAIIDHNRGDLATTEALYKRIFPAKKKFR